MLPEIDNEKHYAELWFGDHPAGHASLTETGGFFFFLYLFLESICSLYGHIPFLLKILSIQNALSLQAHPNRQQAIELHAKDPINYKDSNHKPEMVFNFGFYSLF